MSFINLLKKLPVDLGQGNINKNLRSKTHGKVIAESIIPNVENKIALDIGCREGIQTKWLESKGYNVISIDIEKVYDNCQIVNVNEGLPFENNSFDLIWSSELIEHLENPKESIKEFERVLKPTGKMVLTTPNSYFWLYKIAKLFNKTPKDLQNDDHKHFFSEKHIKEILPNSKIYGFFPYMFKKFTIKKNINLLSPTFVIEASPQQYND
ncbi:class I SAM-dependent methyltransferase [Candidatus Woesearchaeota archaeon]|jgi:SAM-dependent methyltransferase|nr:class I SAM-dependent methyltransferase [Candidatus Woesearchaeota archaeon]